MAKRKYPYRRPKRRKRNVRWGTGPGKSHRKGVSLIELQDMFPDEKSAVKWFEAILWPEGRCCGHCGAMNTKKVKSGKPMPYWCPDCRSYFSVRTGTTLQNSRLPLRKWAFAVYLYVTNLKSISSMKLHRDLEVTQKTAWFMLHRLRQGWLDSGIDDLFTGPVEVDETYVGGERKNMSGTKRRELWLKGHRGPVDKVPVVGIKDRKTKKVKAKVVKKVNAKTMDAFIAEFTDADAKVFTDGSTVYSNIPFEHGSVNHSIRQYVDGEVHTNGIESFWSMLKRAHKGTFHKLTAKHLHRYVAEFEGKHNLRDLDTVAQMYNVVTSMIGKSLMYRTLIRD